MKSVFMNPDQLAALVAVADTGAFDRAARRLGISTSAVSQRIRALESALGRVLVRRGSPSTVTGAGTTVLRYARQQQLLAGELGAELGLGGGAAGEGAGRGEEQECSAPGEAARAVELTVAVNEDSLATWFPAVFAEAACWPDVCLHLVADHEGRTAELLREGSVMAAVSAGSAPVAGCRSESLGEVEYVPVASAALLESGGIAAGAVGLAQGTAGPSAGSPSVPASSVSPAVPEAPGHVADPVAGAVCRLPVLRFDAVDDLEDLVLEAAGLPAGLPGPRVPGTLAYTQALLAGMGWGLLTRSQAAHHPGLVPVPGLGPVRRELTWYRWRLRSALLDRLTAAVHRSFAAHHGLPGPYPAT